MDFETLMADEQFRQKLDEAKDIAAVQALFSEQGLALTEKELLTRILPEGEELSEESLENVSGGGSILSWFRSRFSGGGGGHGF